MNEGTRTEVKDLCQTVLGEWQIKTQALVTNSQQCMQRELNESVQHLFTRYDQGVQQQFREQHAELNRLQEIVEELRRDKTIVWDEIHHLRQTVAVSASPAAARAQKQTQNLDSPPDETVLFAACKERVDKASIVAGTAAWLEQAGFRDGEEYILRGSDLGLSKKWTFQFLGDDGTANRRRNKALQLLKNTDGTWTRIEVVTPLDRTLPLYINVDKTLRRTITEVMTKRLQTVIQDQLPRLKDAVHAVRREGLVTFQWRPLAQVEVKDDKNVVTKWNPPILQKSGLNKATIIAAMEARPSFEDEEIEWQL
jgi:hypothetical protein